MSDMSEELRRRIEQEAKRLREAQKTCDHGNYRGMAVHGRCCPDCGYFLVDFGD